jgi:hypothetical protein
LEALPQYKQVAFEMIAHTVRLARLFRIVARYLAQFPEVLDKFEFFIAK